jgi:creatinine amidohydrolase
MNFPSYRSRYLPAMSAEQIASLPDKAAAPVILAVGAIEQHGPHLPVAVDALIGQVLISLVAGRLPDDCPCYVAPPITIGKSNEHIGFPGTLSISKGTLRELLLAIARQISAWGFRHVAVLNTHGGNVAVLIPTLREFEAKFGLRPRLLKPPPVPDLSAREAAFGIHAGEVETSWVLAAAPALVKMECAGRAFFADVSEHGHIRPVAAPVTRAWATRDLSASGILGDATAATAENGWRWLDAAANALAEQIRVFRASPQSGEEARWGKP